MELITVYRIHLDLPDGQVARLAETLAPDEQVRAARFRFDRLRRRFTVARAALRAVLGDALEVPAAAVAFTYGEHGKPALAGGRAGISFNLSHSEEWGLCAVARGRAVGVDLEAVRPLSEMDALAERFYSPREAALLRSLPDDRRPAAFFRAWSCKEAFVKATGKGLSMSTREVDVSLLPEEPPALLALGGDTAEAARWKLVVLDAVPDFAAALCAEGSDWSARLVDWQP